MEFDEMKKIWDTQNNKPLYAFDEKALHNRIHSNMKTIRHFTSVTEWGLIAINIGAGIVLLGRDPIKKGANLFLYLEAIWMFAIAVYIVAHHIRRIKASRRFDRSVSGDLDHGIFLASYQMHLSQIIRWNLLPMGAIMIFSAWGSGNLLKVSILILFSNTLAFYVNSSGYLANKKRKHKLQALKEKLETDN